MKLIVEIKDEAINTYGCTCKQCVAFSIESQVSKIANLIATEQTSGDIISPLTDKIGSWRIE